MMSLHRSSSIFLHSNAKEAILFPTTSFLEYRFPCWAQGDKHNDIHHRVPVQPSLPRSLVLSKYKLKKGFPFSWKWTKNYDYICDLFKEQIHWSITIQNSFDLLSLRIKNAKNLLRSSMAKGLTYNCEGDRSLLFWEKAGGNESDKIKMKNEITKREESRKLIIYIGRAAGKVCSLCWVHHYYLILWGE